MPTLIVASTRAEAQRGAQWLETVDPYYVLTSVPTPDAPPPIVGRVAFVGGWWLGEYATDVVLWLKGWGADLDASLRIAPP